jgi:hypothetical protein
LLLHPNVGSNGKGQEPRFERRPPSNVVMAKVRAALATDRLALGIPTCRHQGSNEPPSGLESTS